MNAIGIISFDDEVSLPGCLNKKSDMYISLPFKYLMLKLYWLKISSNFFNLNVGGSFFEFMI